MNTIAIIPARLQSKRFPKKILFPIDEKPMVVHVYENVKKSESIDDINSYPQKITSIEAKES